MIVSPMKERRRSPLAKTKRRLFTLRLLILALACAGILIGVSQGEAMVVLQKAVKICLECIGIA